MIQINLLPLESFRQTSSGRLLVAIFCLTMVGVGLALYLYYSVFMSPLLDELKAKEQSINQGLAKAKGQTALALKKATTFVEDMVKVAVISDLEERRRDQTRLFMAIADQVINQASWLVSCSHDKGVARIKGMAIDHEVVANFLSRLQGLSVLRNVDLLRAAEDTVINGVSLVTFEISAQTTFQDSSLIADGLPSDTLPPRETLVKIVTLAAPNLAEALKPKLDGKKKL
ncbi:MAG: PilN domain-containing protein [Deltaproteobacteria bacterium]|jgi:type IV pilus assembly protein PilN|nr:PilN domain-containing protein [Deltaproteobacteria bacterium]